MSNNVGFAFAILTMMFALGLSYQIGKENNWYTKTAILAFKGLTTFLAAVLALYAYSITASIAALLMTLGLLLCALADVLLEINFLTGTACFALGHLAYIAAFIMRKPPQINSIIIFLIFVLISSLAAYHAHKKMRNAILPYFAYSLIISVMVAVSISQPWMTAAGAVLFAVSDAIIARRLINPQKNPWDRTCILLYYSAQFLLAASFVFF